jgi:hypothetical protein
MDFRHLGFVGDHVIQFYSGKLASMDFLSGAEIDFVPFEHESSYSFDGIEEAGANTFTVFEYKMQGSSLLGKHYLFELNGGRIHPICAWKGCSGWNHQFLVDSHTYMTNIVEDGSWIELRDLDTGEVVSKYMVPKDPTRATPIDVREMIPVVEGVFQWNSNPVIYTDALTGQVLPIPQDCELIRRDSIGKRWVTMRKKEPESLGWDCIVFDSENGRELQRFDVSRHHYTLRMVRNGRAKLNDLNELVFNTADFRSFVYDLPSGKLVREYCPFAWVDWTMGCVAIAIGVWCLVWLLVSSRLHSHGWLDAVVCSGVVLAYCGIQYQNIRPTEIHVAICMGIVGGLLYAATTWLVYGKARWSVRFLPLVFATGIVVAIVGFSDQKVMSDEVKFACGMFLKMFFLVTASCGLLSLFCFFGFQFGKQGSPKMIESPNGFSRSAISLQALFLLMVFFALALVITRRTIASWSADFLFELIPMSPVSRTSLRTSISVLPPRRSLLAP